MKKGVLILLFLLVPLTSRQSWAIIFRLGHAVNTIHPYHLGAIRFAELIKKRTHGRIIIKVFPNRILGDEKELIEGLRMGDVDLAVTSTGPLTEFFPRLGVTDLPFIFRSRTHAHHVLDGPIGKELLKGLTKEGIKGLAFWENGFRNITNSVRAIHRPEDVAGLKIRVMQNKIHFATFKILRAIPMEMPWGMVYTALQQHILDAQENPIPVIWAFKLYKVQKYLSMTEHFYSPAIIMMKYDLFQSLRPLFRKILLKTAEEVAIYERKLIYQQTIAGISKLKEKGMLITYPDKKAFRAATKAVYKEFSQQIGEDLIKAVINTK